MEFRVINNFSRYEISASGAIRSRETGKILKWFEGRNGYPKIRLFNDNHERKGVYPHWLVYETWVAPIPEGFEIDHLDGNRINFAVENLIKTLDYTT